MFTFPPATAAVSSSRGLLVSAASFSKAASNSWMNEENIRGCSCSCSSVQQNGHRFNLYRSSLNKNSQQPQQFHSMGSTLNKVHIFSIFFKYSFGQKENQKVAVFFLSYVTLKVTKYSNFTGKTGWLMKRLMGLEQLEVLCLQMPNEINCVQLTWQSTVNLFLSSDGLPRAPGYSQSRSSPSKPCCLRNLMEDWMNTWRLVGDEAMMENLLTFNKSLDAERFIFLLFSWNLVQQTHVSSIFLLVFRLTVLFQSSTHRQPTESLAEGFCDGDINNIALDQVSIYPVCKRKFFWLHNQARE